MFDDPKKELKELEGELLAAEGAQEPAMLDETEFGALYDEIRAEFAPRNDEPPIRNFANGYGNAYTPAASAAPAAPKAAPAPAPAPKKEPRRQRHLGLAFTIFMELAALAVVLGLSLLSLLR